MYKMPFRVTVAAMLGQFLSERFVNIQSCLLVDVWHFRKLKYDR